MDSQEMNVFLCRNKCYVEKTVDSQKNVVEEYMDNQENDEDKYVDNQD